MVLAACRTQDDSAATVPENRSQRGPYFTAFSLHIPDMRVKIGKICARSLRVLIEPVFRYRTPKSDRLLAVTNQVGHYARTITGVSVQPNICNQPALR